MLDEKKIFAKQLQYHMNRNNKTQSDLINDLGINKSTISTWYNGSKMPRMGTIQTLADYFGIMKSDLIEEKENTPAINTAEAWNIVIEDLLGHTPTNEEATIIIDKIRRFLDMLD